MSSNLIILFVLALSLIGMVFFVFKKIPILIELPENTKDSQKEKFYSKLKERIKNLPGLRSFSSDIFLQKILSKVRILSLKTENKTFKWLQNLRNKAKDNKFGENDNYWQEIKKDTKE